MKILIIAGLLFCACQAKNNTTSEKTFGSDSVGKPMVQAPTITEVRTFSAASDTFGYEIWLNGKRIIYQTNIPSMPGNNGFSSEEKAKKAGEFVAEKIRNNQMPPTVTPEELDSLGVLR
jgi:hypothetical protein